MSTRGIAAQFDDSREPRTIAGYEVAGPQYGATIETGPDGLPHHFVQRSTARGHSWLRFRRSPTAIGGFDVTAYGSRREAIRGVTKLTMFHLVRSGKLATYVELLEAIEAGTAGSLPMVLHQDALDQEWAVMVGPEVTLGQRYALTDAGRAFLAAAKGGKR